VAYESKAGFLISLEKRMAEEMTANEMNKALRIVAEDHGLSSAVIHRQREGPRDQ
jgi:hypothetical protein